MYKENATKRNLRVDICRIVMASLILYCHYYVLVKGESHSSDFAVQCFFVLAGLLERQSLEGKKQDEKLYKIIGKKFWSIWPMYAISFFMILCGRVWILVCQGFSIGQALEIIPLRKSVPELFMMQNLAGVCIINALSWYMSAYFISEIIIIVLFWLIKNKNVLDIVYVSIPLLWYAYCGLVGRSIQWTDSWGGIMYGLSGISLGCVAWRIKYVFWKSHFENFFTTGEYAITLFLTAATISFNGEITGGGYLATALCIFLCISALFNREMIKENIASRIITFLGKLSFPIYLVQVLPMIMYQLEYISLETFKKIYLPLTLLLGILLYLLDKIIRFIFDRLYGIVKTK